MFTIANMIRNDTLNAHTNQLINITTMICNIAAINNLLTYFIANHNFLK